MNDDYKLVLYLFGGFGVLGLLGALGFEIIKIYDNKAVLDCIKAGQAVSECVKAFAP